MSAVGNLQLIENIRNVIANGLLADDQCARNLCIARAARQQVKDFAFALGQFGEWLRRLGIELCKEVDQPPRDGGAITTAAITNLATELIPALADAGCVVAGAGLTGCGPVCAGETAGAGCAGVE